MNNQKSNQMTNIARFKGDSRDDCDAKRRLTGGSYVASDVVSSRLPSSGHFYGIVHMWRFRCWAATYEGDFRRVACSQPSALLEFPNVISWGLEQEMAIDSSGNLQEMAKSNLDLRRATKWRRARPGM